MSTSVRLQERFLADLRARSCSIGCAKSIHKGKKSVLPLFAQELTTSCIAACVRMVLTDLGLSLAEAEIRHRCGHSKVGMRLNEVAGGLKDLPVAVGYET